MEQDIKDFWDKRFAEPGYAYGTEPNDFFKSEIDKLQPGAILIPGAGEGRDGVYAAKQGWTVQCADLSESGRQKTLLLAKENNVNVQYDCRSISDVEYGDNQFDVIAATFFHLDEPGRQKFSNNVLKWLKPGGYFVAELFTKEQLKNNSGGPKDVSMLSGAAEMQNDFGWMEIISNEETETVLNEGKYHQGKANVVRFVGRKKQQ